MISKEEIKIMNYIFSKEEDNKEFTKLELQCATKIDLFNIKIVNLCKIIWDNKDNEDRLERFINIIDKKEKKIINKKGDKHMNDIMIFKNDNFGEIRSLEINNEPWFVGKEITKILGYQNGSRDINRHIDEEDRRVVPFRYYLRNTRYNHNKRKWFIHFNNV